MTSVAAPPIDQRLQGMAAVIHQLAQADVSLDLLLYSQQECQERRHWRSHVIGRAYREGRLQDGAL